MSSGEPLADPGRFCADLYPRLLGSLLLTTGDRCLAEDLAQETLCRVVERWPRVSAMDSPEGWAFTVALNLSRSTWRRLASGRRAMGRLRSWDAGPSALDGGIEQLGTRQAVRDAVLALPVRQRQVIALRYFADLSVADTAVAMGCADGTVKSLTSKASAALARELGSRSLGLVVDGGWS